MAQSKNDPAIGSDTTGFEADLPELSHALTAKCNVKLGTLLAKIGREVGGVTLDIKRDKMPPRLLSLD